jgi:hypothetical protein
MAWAMTHPTTIDGPRRSRLATGLGRARRGLPLALRFAVVHAVVITGAAAATLALREVAMNHRVGIVLAIFAAGSALGGFLAVLVAAAVAGHRPPPKRFAAMLATLTFGTAGGIALVYLVQFRLIQPDFYEDFPSLHFLEQMLFTGASAAYTFTVSGLPLILPHGLAALFGAAIWFARRPRG